MVRTYLLTIAFICAAATARPQGSTLPLGADAYPIIDRFDISSGMPAPFFTSLK